MRKKTWIVRLWILLVARKSAVTVSTVNDQLWSLYTLRIMAIAFKWTNVSTHSICHDGNKVDSGNKLTLKRRLCNVWFFLFLYFAMHRQPSRMRARLIYKYYSIFTSLGKIPRLMDRYWYILIQQNWSTMNKSRRGISATCIAIVFHRYLINCILFQCLPLLYTTGFGKVNNGESAMLLSPVKLSIIDVALESLSNKQITCY